MPTPLRVRGRPGPAIAWAPTRGTHEVPPEQLRGATRLPDLYLTQAAILEIDAHMRESESPLPFGLLAGALCFSPRENLVYLLADTVSRSGTELSGADDPYVGLAADLRSLATEQELRGNLTIGWYVGGMGDDLTLDSDVIELHRELFPEPRHVLLLRGEAAGVQHGAFLHLDGSPSRSYAISFYELLPEHANAKRGERRTAVGWAEYHTHEHDLLHLESDTRAMDGRLLTAARWHPRRLGASLRALRQAFRAKAPAETRPHSASGEHVSTPSPSRDAVPAVVDIAKQQRPARREQSDARQAPEPRVTYVVIDGTIVPFSRARRLSRKYRLYRSARRVMLALLFAVVLLLLMMLLAYWMAR